MPIDFDISAFREIAGSENSTGFVAGTADGGLVKMGAHRHLTGLNEAELARIAPGKQSNAAVRAAFLKAIAAAIEPDREFRSDLLRFAAEQLGVSLTEENGRLSIDIENISTDPLPRRDIRQILRMIDKKDFGLFLNAEGDDRAANSLERREAMINALVGSVKGVDMRSLPYSAMDNDTIRVLGRCIATGTISTEEDLLCYVRLHTEPELINTEEMLIRLAKTEARDPDEVKQLVTLHSEKAGKKAPAQLPAEDAPKVEGGPAGPEPGAKPSAPSSGRTEAKAEQPEPKGLLGSIFGGLKSLNAMAQTNKRLSSLGFMDAAGALNTLASALAPEPGDGRTGVQRLRGALKSESEVITVLLCRTDDFLKALPGGEGFKAEADALKKALLGGNPLLGPAMLNAGTQAVVLGKIREALGDEKSEMYIDDKALKGILDTLGDILGADAAQKAGEAGKRLSAVTSADVREFLADVVFDSKTWIHDLSKNPGERLRSTLSRHLDALTALLCRPKSLRQGIGGPAGMMLDKALEEIRSRLGTDIDGLFTEKTQALARIALGNTLAAMPAEKLSEMDGAIASGTEYMGRVVRHLSDRGFASLLENKPLGDMDTLLKECLEDMAEEDKLTGTPREERYRIVRANREKKAAEADLAKKTAVPDPDTEFTGFIMEWVKQWPSDVDEAITLKVQEMLIRHASELPAPTIAQMAEAEGKSSPEELLRSILSSIGGDRFKPDDDGITAVDFMMTWEKQWPADVQRTIDGELSRLVFGLIEKGIPNPTLAQAAAQAGKESVEAWLKSLVPAALRSGNDPEFDLIRRSSLDDLVGKGALDTRQGYGLFMVKVMEHYFEDVSTIDKRSMLSSLIRFGSSENAGPNASVREQEEADRKNMAAAMGAMFKGAGPIMHKMLQQLASSDIAPEFKAALEDMKCNLLPIPDDVQRCQLLEIIDSANKKLPDGRKIANITVDKPLGAASVGQSLLCTVTDASGTKQSVVIKLLRPDVENRMNREKEVFLKAAAEVPGMTETFKGRLKRVQEELDLRIEAANVKSGRVYDSRFRSGRDEFNDVKAMKTLDNFETAADIMVLERAPGDTVSNFLADVEKKTGEILKQGSLEGLDTLSAMKDDLLRKHGQLSRMAFKWVEQGMFKSGFYHGDLHAGNIMVDTEPDPQANRGVTIIDFGNATHLSGTQRSAIMRMVYAATEKNTDIFLENYRELLEGRTQDFDACREQAAKRITAIFAKGSEEDTGKRIAAALLQMQKLGVETPAPIFNFSNCQILLQGTIDGMVKAIHKVDKARAELSGLMDKTFTDEGIYSRLKEGFESDGNLEELKRYLRESAMAVDDANGNYRLLCEMFDQAVSQADRGEIFGLLNEITALYEKQAETDEELSRENGSIRSLDALLKEADALGDDNAVLSAENSRALRECRKFFPKSEENKAEWTVGEIRALVRSARVPLEEKAGALKAEVLRLNTSILEKRQSNRALQQGVGLMQSLKNSADSRAADRNRAQAGAAGPASFFDTMGAVLNAHKLKAAWAVGVGASMKYMFSALRGS